MLVRLMYTSRSNTGMDEQELASILRQSRPANTAEGITGMLVFSDQLFIQVLEGGRSEVNRLYNRICADKRHTDIELLYFEEITERRFAGWSMGQVNMARVNTALLLKYSEKPQLNPYAVSGKITMALFEELVSSASVIGER
jgi:hypothetical protein